MIVEQFDDVRYERRALLGEFQVFALGVCETPTPRERASLLETRPSVLRETARDDPDERRHRQNQDDERRNPAPAKVEPHASVEPISLVPLARSLRVHRLYPGGEVGSYCDNGKGRLNRP